MPLDSRWELYYKKGSVSKRRLPRLISISGLLLAPGYADFSALKLSPLRRAFLF
jgi:hypothetical protein